MKRFLALAAIAGLLVVLSAPARAQACSDLSVTGTVNPGQTLTIAVTGATPDSFTALAVGEETGSTTLNFGPLASLTLGLASPFAILPLGVTDANGDVSVSFDIPSAPANAPSLPNLTLNAQAVTASFSFGMGPPGLSFCVSDVEQITVGTGG
jgi:hypothetical protein